MDKQKLHAQFLLLAAIRDFFRMQGFLDVLTPPMVSNPGYEAHIHPFSAYSNIGKSITPYYLHTSPEFHMKELLSLGFENIFNLSYCFRDEPNSPIHRCQFLMLEWYRAHSRYEAIMDDCESLISYCQNYLQQQKIPTRNHSHNLKRERYTIQELFQEYLHLDILNFLERHDIAAMIEKDFKEIPLPKDHLQRLHWDDYYFLLFLNLIEPRLVERDFLLLYEFPHHLNALSTIKQSDPRVCERFEIYIHGIELCNCFNELTDITIQRQRFREQSALKKQCYGYSLPEATTLFQALSRGLPPSAGIALGVERLLSAITKIENPFYF
ncbi:MAG: hypothetical protein HQK52_10910 [Oligoflexia bacterium]|nr:hypothetical protein [Oligoflexia bacterium]